MIDAAALSQPHVRRELQTYLSELGADDPQPSWRAERDTGLASGIDQVFHFFFDDNDFDEGGVGTTLLGGSELHLIVAVRHAMEQILAAFGDADDDAFVEHPLWAGVRHAAAAADTRLASRTNGS
jgi:hypothetical protein